MASLTFNNVTKTFGSEVVAVKDLHAEIEDGEFLVVVGPSGCGKTTTLRMVAGFEDVSEGEIKIGNNVVNDHPPSERDIAMVFQSYALYPHMTVRQNMSFGLEQSTDFPSEKISSTVQDISEMLDIEDLLDRKPEELSGGQQQRVALGRAIVRDPDVFLMDEPLSNLDAKLRSQMRAELQRLQEKLNVTTVYVTHDQTEAMTMGDRIAILNGGDLQQIGTPLECYYEPANRFVAGFIGEPSMNIIDLSLDEEMLRSDGFEYCLSEEVVQNLGNVTDVSLGIRPEDIEIYSEPKGQNDFPATINVVEPFGKEHNFYLQPDDSNLEDPLIATVNGRRKFNQEDHVGVRLPEESIHLFDRESGTTLRCPQINTNGENMSISEYMSS